MKISCEDISTEEVGRLSAKQHQLGEQVVEKATSRESPKKLLSQLESRTTELVQPLWKTVRRFRKNIETELPCDPAIPLLGIYLKKMKTLIQKGTCRDFPGGPVVKTLRFPCRGHGFDPWWGN